MFTGLIQKCGTICKREGLTLEVAVKDCWKDLEFGESIAINGTCLTLERQTGNVLTFHTLSETLKRTNLGVLPLGSMVNMERALRMGSPLDGHLVSGHVDATGRVKKWVERPGGDMELTVELPENIAALVAEKGSIAIDGVSLTISDLGDDWLAVDLIPVTARETTLGSKNIGDKVNLEGDVVGKYAAKAISSQGLTEEALRRAGFIEPGMD
jgi:riboflavin synthase